MGIRAKDNSFNATTHIDFDESLSADEAGVGKINIIPQDIGKVPLNLLNNAFYAINEKKKMSGDTNVPIIFVNTKKINDKVEIKVKDNGIGVPPKALDKFFNHFFATKPTGQ
jgi:two-component system, NtrC family, sensor kinase